MKTETLKQISVARKIILCTVIVYIVIFFALNASKISADNIMRLFYDFDCVVKNRQAAKTVEFEESDDNSFYSFKNGLVTLTSTGVSVYNEKGYEISEFPANYTDSVIKTAGDNIFIFTRGGSSVTRTNSFDTELSKDTGSRIINLSADKRGYVAVISDAYGYKGRLTVYNKAFEELYYWDISSFYPMYTEFVSSNTVAVVSLSPDKESCDTVITFVNYTTGEEIATYTAEDVVPYDVYKRGDGKTEIFTSGGLYELSLDKFEKIIDNVCVDMSHYAVSDEYFAAAEYSDKSANSSLVRVYDKSGNELFSENVENMKALECNSEYVFVSSGKTVYVFDNTGNIIFEREEAFYIQNIVAVDGGAYLIGSDCAVRINV